MKLAEKFFLTVIVFLLYSGPINCNASDFITKTAILTPVADTCAYQFGTTASASDTELRVGCQKIGDTKNEVISLLRFDVSEVTEPSQIKSALLHVYALDIKPASVVSSFQAMASSKNWTESDPAYPIESLAGLPVYDSRYISGISGTSPDLYLWDITDLVQAWIAGRPNYGIVLTADLEKTSDYIRFYASENPIYKPCIKVMYAVPETSFAIEPVNENDQGVSAGEASKPAGTVESDPEDLNIKEAVFIMDHPASQSQEAGKTVMFQVRSAGSGPLSFQWKKNHIDIQGADSENYIIKSVQKKDEGIYACEVSNDFSNDISDDANLTVTVLSQIQTQPSPENKGSGPLPEDSVNDSEAPPLPVKAEKDVAVPKEDADQPPPVEAPFEKHTEPDVLIADAPEIADPPEILTHPAAQTKNPGEPAAFSVSVSGAEPFAYQWKQDGTDIDGATSQNHIVDAVSEIDEGSFSCMISNDAGSVLSDSARLSVNDPIQITSHPDSQTGKSGESVTFSVSISGTGPFAYQWKKDGTDIPFAILDTITLSPLEKEDAGIYACEVSNEFSTAVSDDAVLSIIEVPVLAAKESEESADHPTDKPDFFDLRLSPPSGQGQYVRNGNALTFEGSGVPGATLVFAHLEDDQGFLIRDVSKAVTIDTETGYISGAVFVGSFRSALSVRLRIRVLDDLAHKTVNGLSNRLFVDNTDPEITANTPADQSTFKSAPIVISGLAVDSVSGIAKIEISTDGGVSYQPVDSFVNGRWQYLFTPTPAESMYTINVRATDAVGRTTVSDSRVVYYQAPSRSRASSPSIRKTALQPDSSGAGDHRKTYDKYLKEDGIGTYRIISLGDNQFQPSDLFTLDEEMAIIVKGHGGEVVTVKLIDPAAEKVVFELSDYIPANKHKMWKWKLSKTGIFRATLFIGGSPRDNVYFKIIQ